MRLFAYGSLAFSEVFHAVTGRRFHGTPATLIGYARYLISSKVYPAIVEKPDGRVDGVLYAGIDGILLRLLDRYEGVYYTRKSVVVESRALSPTSLSVRRSGPSAKVEAPLHPCRLSAETYLIHPQHRHRLSDSPWHPDTFRRYHMRGFLCRYAATSSAYSTFHSSFRVLR